MSKFWSAYCPPLLWMDKVQNNQGRGGGLNPICTWFYPDVLFTSLQVMQLHAWGPHPV